MFGDETKKRYFKKRDAIFRQGLAFALIIITTRREAADAKRTLMARALAEVALGSSFYF